MDKRVWVPSSDNAEEKIGASSHGNTHNLFLGGIFLLLILMSLNAASEIAILIVLAFMLKLVFHPLVRVLRKLRLPLSLIAVLIIVVLVSATIGLATALSGPAASWAEKLPDSYAQLQMRLSFLRKPVEKTQNILVQAENLTKADGVKVMPVAMQGTRLYDKLFKGTQTILFGFFTTIIVLFFLVAAGDTFLRRLVEVLPRFKDKRQAVDISQAIEHDISRYLLTITAMNACVGIATALTMRLFHVDDAMLWGTLAFLLNYVPIIGPLICAGILMLVGLSGNEAFLPAIIPSHIYCVIHLLEGTFITPMLVAKRFTLNPVIVILSLVFWYWIWGVAGAILAMPMLVITKIICDRIERLTAFGHFLEG